MAEERPPDELPSKCMPLCSRRDARPTTDTAEMSRPQMRNWPQPVNIATLRRELFFDGINRIHRNNKQPAYAGCFGD